MRCAYFSFQQYSDDAPRGLTCASAAMLDSISRLIEVELIYLWPSKDRFEIAETLRERFPLVKGIRVFSYNPIASKMQRLICAARLLPLSLGGFLDANVRDNVRAIHKEQSFDVVHYDLMVWLFVHPSRKQLTKPTICSGHDAYSLAYFRKAPFRDNLFKRLREMLGGLIFSRFEARYLPKADIVHMFSENDVNYLRRKGVNAIFRLTNLPLEDKWFEGALVKPQGSCKRILLSGQHSHPWYRKGVLQFLNVIWPQIHAKYPDATLTIHSSHLAPDIGEMAKTLEHVQVVGKVDDFRQLFAEHDYFVHPLLSGTGQKTRLAIAMAQGLCCIATDAAIAGMGMRPHKDYVPLNVNSPDVGTILSILGNQELSRSIAQSGHSRVKAEFSIHSVGNKLVDIYAEAISLRGIYTSSKLCNIQRTVYDRSCGPTVSGFV